MKPNSDQPKAPDIQAGIEARCEGRFEIPAPGGGGEKIGHRRRTASLKPRRRSG